MNNRLVSMTLAAALAASLGACNKNWKIDRTDPADVADLDYTFDEDDARQIYQGMVADALSKPWLDNWMDYNPGQRPIIVVGTVRNDTQDYINTDLVTDPLREELLNSGRIRVFMARDLREEVRQERVSSEQFARPEYVKAIADEISADYIMLGRVKDDKEYSRNRKRVISYYQVTLELIDVVTGEVVWIQTEEIEKRARR